MTDKEERIRVLVLKNPCEKCDIKPCTRKCMFRTLFEKAPGMTRQEAIEVMAKTNWIAVVCAKNQIVPTGVSKEEWDAEWAKLRSDYKKVYYSGAEASLNDLLEGGKNEK